MNSSLLQPPNLKPVAPTLEEVRAQIAAMPPEQHAVLSPAWVARVEQATTADAFWILGFSLVLLTNGTVVGQCAFKGPPDADASVEIAYMVAHENQPPGG
jgi:hypothetical protein